MIEEGRPKVSDDQDDGHRQEEHQHGVIRFGLSKYTPLFFAAALLALPACFPVGEAPNHAAAPAGPPPAVRLARLERLVWQPPVLRPTTILGMRLIADAPRPALESSAVARSIVRSNPPVEPFEALLRAQTAVDAARANGLPPGFFAATMLQESAFDDRALSAAGAVGIAQFTIETADGYGVNPFDWRDALRGSARLFGTYASAYAGAEDPYALALAAYNAGPGAVERYRGVPPYPETIEYIGLVYERWSRIVRDMSPPPQRR